MRRLAAPIACAVVLALPSVALACPVCFGANEANRDAFAATTAFLSLLPLAMFGGFVLFVRSRLRAANVAEPPREPPDSKTDPDEGAPR